MVRIFHLQDHPANSLYALTGNQFALPYVFEFRPSPEFNYDAGRDKLMNLHLFADSSSEVLLSTPGDDHSHNDYGEGTDAGDSGRRGRLLRLSAAVDMESRLTIGCAGALLTYVTRRKAVEYVPDDDYTTESFRISALEMFNLKNTM